jgi:hypothetical protein
VRGGQRGGRAAVPLPIFDDPADEAKFRGCTALVVLPTRNEEAGLARTLAALPLSLTRAEGSALRTVVIDGGSTDGTAEVARRAGVPLLHQRGRGKGEALVEAIEWAHRMGIPHVIVLDADATYPPDQIAPALALLRAGMDLIVGVRRPVWGPPRHLSELVHRTGNVLLSWTASLLSHRAVLDVCSGFWGVSTTRFVELGLGEAQFAIEAELVVKALRTGLRVGQIPVAYADRVGTSKLRTWHDGGAIFLSILQFARSTPSPPRTTPSPPARLRDLLSIGVITRTSGAIVTCGPSERGRAEELAALLRRGLPQATIEIETSGRGTSDPTSPFRPHLRVHVARDRTLGSSPNVTVAVHSGEHRLRIHLPSADGSPPERPSRRATSDPSATWPARFAVVTSRLNYDPLAMDRSMLFANGLAVDEMRGMLLGAGRGKFGDD